MGRTRAGSAVVDRNGVGTVAAAKDITKTAVGRAREVGITITAPRFETAAFRLVGTVPLVMNAFSRKAREEMRQKMEKGHQAKKGKAREPKDFKAAFEGAKHKATAGWIGIPAGAIRKAMISACRIVGFQMTRAKLSLFVEADGFDAEDGTPLVRITKGTPRYVEHPVRNESGVADIRPRPMWDPGWEAVVRLRWDADQFSVSDVTNLLLRVGQQVGLLEGRPDSKESAGMGWGLFRLAQEGE